MRDHIRIFCPYKRKMTGTGANATAKNANRLVAQGKPRLWYIALAKRGNPAPKQLRTTVLAEIALFA
jgi:hypothetical protein